jgi:hypothetical protein
MSGGTLHHEIRWNVEIFSVFPRLRAAREIPESGVSAHCLHGFGRVILQNLLSLHPRSGQILRAVSRADLAGGRGHPGKVLECSGAWL